MATLLASFDRLMFARGYDGVTIRALTADANVGRSTFYEHFGGKEDLLELSLSRLAAELASSSTSAAKPDALRAVLLHVRERRGLARNLLQGPARSILIRALASQIERELAALARASGALPIAPLPFLASSLAHGQVGVLETWICMEDRYDVQTATRVLHTATRAHVEAVFSLRRL